MFPHFYPSAIVQTGNVTEKGQEFLTLCAHFCLPRGTQAGVCHWTGERVSVDTTEVASLAVTEGQFLMHTQGKASKVARTDQFIRITLVPTREKHSCPPRIRLCLGNLKAK